MHYNKNNKIKKTNKIIFIYFSGNLFYLIFICLLLNSKIKKGLNLLYLNFIILFYYSYVIISSL